MHQVESCDVAYWSVCDAVGFWVDDRGTDEVGEDEVRTHSVHLFLVNVSTLREETCHLTHQPTDTRREAVHVLTDTYYESCRYSYERVYCPEAVTLEARLIFWCSLFSELLQALDWGKTDRGLVRIDVQEHLVFHEELGYRTVEGRCELIMRGFIDGGEYTEFNSVISEWWIFKKDGFRGDSI